MTLVSALAVYFLIWWIVLFAVLPFGLRSQDESGDVSPGSEPGAPESPGLGRKFAITSLISAIFFSIYYVAVVAIDGDLQPMLDWIR